MSSSPGSHGWLRPIHIAGAHDALYPENTLWWWSRWLQAMGPGATIAVHLVIASAEVTRALAVGRLAPPAFDVVPVTIPVCVSNLHNNAARCALSRRLVCARGVHRLASSGRMRLSVGLGCIFSLSLHFLSLAALFSVFCRTRAKTGTMNRTFFPLRASILFMCAHLPRRSRLSTENV
ncbi:hypothetical protein pclt_cds_996 [Pandoravirus celtis]|uniref:Uncharacterized protein n=1 Tax=Pandoravirus celtis TaxID=2568002 RepID=A0A4D6EJN3_9VIRU|nr:hypothetical protein pclt_cds_996 [Pandoravirus celtis]